MDKHEYLRILDAFKAHAGIDVEVLGNVFKSSRRVQLSPGVCKPEGGEQFTLNRQPILPRTHLHNLSIGGMRGQNEVAV